MKSSFYNIYINASADESILFNSLTTGMLIVSNEIIHCLKENKIEDIDENILKQLYNERFVVPDEVNENEILRYSYELDKYNSRVFTITIAPTMECNLACTYCFEQGLRNKKHLIMKEDIQDAIIKYIETICNNFSGLRIVWFGGEPLLGLEVIEKLSNKIMKIAEKNNLGFSASMITNGILISKYNGLIEFLKRNKVEDIQITLDGSESEHNKRRKYKSNGKGTFNEVINAIKLLKDSGIHLGIRINVDIENQKSFRQLFEFLKEQQLLEMDLNFGHVRNYGKQNSSCYASVEQFCDIHMKSYDMLKSLRENESAYHYPTLVKPCVANRENTLVIDDGGYLYKCRTLIGDKENAYGNIKEIASINLHQGMELAKWVGWSPFEYVKCRECKYMPLCMGGCAYNCFLNENEPECNEWSYYLEETLLRLYH